MRNKAAFLKSKIITSARPENIRDDMKEEGIEDPVRWSMEQLKTRLPAMVREAGYEEIANKIDQESIAENLCQVERDIFAKV